MNQVQKSSSIIEKVVHAIANARIVQEPSNSDSRDIMDLQEFYEVMERHRMEVRCCVCNVSHAHAIVSPSTWYSSASEASWSLSCMPGRPTSCCSLHSA